MQGTKTSTREKEKKQATEVIKYPSSTEKSIRLMESENKLIFIVDKKATKSEIKKAIEELYETKVVSVQTTITKGEKKAYVKFSQEKPAIDVATKLGMI
ncbi:MAG: 50S ribosomal protein L23 [Nanoarchaeota archaeon]|nr:50S ribosomal protein L23 [Nanoarchaeota archaeon]